ncbi:hypothetical protein FOL47_007991 [Perkinsus chesapeaki]|uniref:Uncharacterized protein n=1 Tax=Perkinsus chesapeaki TaxID=330153 RepID=A0A7J6LGI7_PERCH|nr:hypothetical protein FOL47_007991 [Perkinsus chesapeaki]
MYHMVPYGLGYLTFEVFLLMLSLSLFIALLLALTHASKRSVKGMNRYHSVVGERQVVGNLRTIRNVVGGVLGMDPKQLKEGLKEGVEAATTWDQTNPEERVPFNTEYIRSYGTTDKTVDSVFMKQ